MRRIRKFVVAIVAAVGLVAFVGPAANAIIVHAEIGEGVDPSAPPEPAPGALVGLCLTIRSANSTNCISI